MQSSGIENAIRELEREGKQIQDAISLLRRIRADRSGGAAPARAARTGRRLSAAARRRISEAAKRRWAAVRAKSESGRGKAKSAA